MHGKAPWVSTRSCGRIAWIEADHPPVNALSQPVRQALVDGVEALADGDAADAIVIAARGRTFFAGADIGELDRGVQAPGLLALVHACDRARPVVIGALHGTVFGGGVVVAYACDWRIAAAGTRFALPELGLGLLPTFGGTQWLPRWLGVEAALDLVIDGAQWSADEARRAGLVDEVVPAAQLDDAVAVLASQRPPKRRIGDPARWRALDAAGTAAAFARRRERLAATQPAFDAARVCLDVMQRGLALPIDEALRLEHAAFEQLRASPQSRRLRRLFLAERRLRRTPIADEAAVREAITATANDAEAIAALARRLLAEHVVPDAELLDALIVQTLQRPRHAPSPIQSLLDRTP